MTHHYEIILWDEPEWVMCRSSHTVGKGYHNSAQFLQPSCIYIKLRQVSPTNILCHFCNKGRVLICTQRPRPCLPITCLSYSISRVCKVFVQSQDCLQDFMVAQECTPTPHLQQSHTCSAWPYYVFTPLPPSLQTVSTPFLQRLQSFCSNPAVLPVFHIVSALFLWSFCSVSAPFLQPGLHCSRSSRVFYSCQCHVIVYLAKNEEHSINLNQGNEELYWCAATWDCMFLYS